MSARKALVWGLLWAAVAALAMSRLAPDPWPMQPSRANELRASLTVLSHGGPPLLGYVSGGHTPYAIGYSDDQGIYAIVPVLSHWLGRSDPVAVLRSLWLVVWCLTVLFSAIVFRAIFRSTWATLVAPPALLVCILSFGFGDVYWVTAWAAVALLPLLILLGRRGRPRHLWLALPAIGLAAGVIGTIRSQAGLPVALAAVGVAWLAAAGASPGRRRLWVRGALAAAVVVAYLLPLEVGMPAIRAYRDHRVGVNLSRGVLTSHPLWHSLYIGLGYTSNPYGIHYADRYAMAAAQQANPGVRYLSPAYASVLHHQVEALLKHDLGFVVKSEAQKALVELANAGPYILLIALLLPAALAADGEARIRRRELALFLPAVAIGALPAIVAAPYRGYELTELAPLGTLALLAVGSMAARAQMAWMETTDRKAATPSGRASSASRALYRQWRSRATLRVLLATAIVLVPALAIGRRLEAEHSRWDRQERSSPTVVLASDGSLAGDAGPAAGGQATGTAEHAPPE